MSVTKVTKPKATKPKAAVGSPIDALIAKAVRGDGVSRAHVRDQPPAKVVPTLLALFGDGSAKIRANAIGLATGIIPFAKLVPVERVIGALGDGDKAVRLAAVMALKISTPIWKPHAAAIKPALERCLVDADKTVKEQAGHAWRLLEL